MSVRPHTCSTLAEPSSARRVQHEHRGEQSVVLSMSSLTRSTTICGASDAASSSHLSSKSSPWRPAGWGDLPTDWLGCVSVFLSLRDLSSSFLPVCRRWRDGARTTGPPRHEEIGLNDERLAQLGDASNDVRRHVAAICMTDALSRASLALTRRLPHLTCLEGSWADAEMGLEFPTQLTELTLMLEVAADDDGTPKWIQLQRMLNDVSQVSRLTRLHITLQKNDRYVPALIPLETLQPLARLRDSLTSLTIVNHPASSAYDAPPFPRAHVDFLCSLHRLESLQLDGIGVWTAESLAWVTDPMTRVFRCVPFDLPRVDDSTVAVISRLTSLVEFSPQRLVLRDPSFIGNFTQLTSADLHCGPGVDPALLVVALAHCTHLEEITIGHPGITSEHFCMLLPSLPRLTYLDLRAAASLTSLAFASSVGHLAHTLEKLRVLSCTALPPDEIRHLCTLAALRQLDLRGSFNARLDCGTIARMSPMSPQFARDVWPHLWLSSPS